MMLDKIKVCLTEKGFRSVEVNVKGIYLHYIAVSQEVYIIAMLDCPTGKEFTTEQYSNIRRQIYNNFANQSQDTIHLLSLVCTNNVLGVRNLCEEEKDQWIIDTTNNQLIIYEHQSGDFFSLRRDIENILQSSQKEEKVEEVEYNTSSTQAMNQSSKRNFRASYLTICNTALIVLNVLVFLTIDISGSSFLLEEGALYWPAVEQLKEYYRLFTYMFLHSGLEHLANNMLVLLFIGSYLERATGKWKYLVIYFTSGVLAGIASLGYNMLNNTNTISVGASGAIFGVVGAMAYVVIINKGRLEDISSRQIAVFVIFSLYGGFTSQRVDNAAHVGGLIAGIVLAAILYRKPKKKQQERGR